MALSQSQLTKLGERLRGVVTEADLRCLDEYRRSFTATCDVVVQSIKTVLGLQPTVRSAKSTKAIIEKINRQSSRLGQIQDIAGCRIVVESVARQDEVVNRLRELFPACRVEDRRAKPSHGYRAVHVIVKQDDRWVEVQVRTELQHLWASASEKLADEHGHGLKYGEGAPQWLQLLGRLALMVATMEELESPDRAQALGYPLDVLPTARETLVELLKELTPDASEGDGRE